MAKANFEDIVKSLQDNNQTNKNRYDSLSDQQIVIKALDAVQNSIIKSVAVLVEALLTDTLKTKITNMPELAINATNEIVHATEQVKLAVDNKSVDLSGILTHLEGIHADLNRLPTEYPSFPDMPTEMAVNNLDGIIEKLDSLSKEISKLKPAPNIEVKAPKITVNLDKELKNFTKAIKEIKIPQSKTDTKGVEQAVKKVEKAIQSIQFPVPNFRTQDIVEAIENINISTGDITVGAFSDPSNVDRKALVDADRHIQVDVLTAPPVSVDTTGLATDTKQDTQISELQDIEADIESTNTRLGEVQATPTANTVLARLKTIADNQLPDSHNVTVDNASLAITASSLPLPTGAATAANQQTDALTNTQLRATPVPVSGTISTGLSQPLTDTQLRATAVPVTGTVNTEEIRPATPALSNVTMTGSSVTLVAANNDRKGLYIFNDSGVTVYVKCGTAASSTSFTIKMVDQSYYELPQPIYTGIVTALGASGVVRCTEID